MEENKPPFNQTGTRVLNWIFALALTLVVCAIGSVAWNCIDSLQKHTSRLQTYHATAENTKIDTHRFDVAKELDSRIIADKMDPMVALQAPMKEGSEMFFERGTLAMNKQQFVQAEAEFSQALAIIPVEATKRKSWHMGELIVDRRIYLATAYEMRACCCMETGHFSQAIVDLTASIKLRPDYVTNYRNRAKVYDLLGQKALSAADLKMVQAISAGKSR